MKLKLLFFAIQAFLLFAAFGADISNRTYYDKFFKSYCTDCHNSKTAKGKFDIGQLGFELKTIENREQWDLILEYVEEGDMPTKKAKVKLPAAERNKFVDTLKVNMQQADATLNPGGTVLRRLNSTEYENSVKSLFPIRNLKLLPTFPLEGEGEGFDTRSDEQHVTGTLLAEYAKMADEIAGRMVFLPGLPQEKVVNDYKVIGGYPHFRNGSKIPLFSGNNSRVQTGALYPVNFSAPYSGKYNLALNVKSEAKTGSDGKPLTLLFYAIDGREVNQHLKKFHDMEFIGSLEVPYGDFKTFTYSVDLEQGDYIYIFCKNRYPEKTRGKTKKLSKEEKEKLKLKPSILLKSIAVNGPVEPNERQKSFIGNYKNSENKNTVSKILLPLAEKIYRRPLNERESGDLIKDVLQHTSKAPYQDLAWGIHYGIRKLLCSPQFIFREMSPGKLNSFDLASRLSYFLWSAPPDDKLYQKAKNNSLLKSEVLTSEIVRMLTDKRASAFTENFAGQWLGNRKVENVMVCNVRHVWGESVRHSYMMATDAFFNEVLKKNLSIRTFIDSDFTYEDKFIEMAMGRKKADEKSLNNKNGSRFVKKVKVEKKSNRGGVLGLPGVMLATSDGVDSHPIIRGNWVLDNLFGTPAPPPPANVQVGKVDVSKAKTVKEMLQMHKEEESCSTCHRRMDPLGLALENFNAVGKWRTNYIQEESKETGPKVETNGTLVDGTQVNGPADIKKYLLKNSHMFTNCLCTKLLEYATGRKMTAGDKRVIKEIVDEEPEKGYRFRDLIIKLVNSEVFRAK